PRRSSDLRTRPGWVTRAAQVKLNWSIRTCSRKFGSVERFEHGVRANDGAIAANHTLQAPCRNHFKRRRGTDIDYWRLAIGSLGALPKTQHGCGINVSHP